MNLSRNTTINRLFLAILFSFLSVVVLESVAVGELLVAPISGLGDAAKRLGIHLDDLNVTNGIRRLRISFTEGIKHGDIGKIVAHAKAKGARSLVLDTGQVVNPKIAARIEKAIAAGKPYLGGTPRLVREVPNIIPGGPSVKIFEIVFN